MVFYEWLKGHDVLTWLEPLWESGRWFMNSDGKLEAVRTQAALDTPWVHHGHLDKNNCVFGQLVFNTISRKISQHFADMRPFVPSGCQNCYKVVVRPQNLIQLFALDDLQTNFGHPCKAGIELRPSVEGLYGGYFYNQGLEDGKACYVRVRAAIDANPHLGPEVPVILKRGCTEMEHETGPSDKWEVSEEQVIIENLVREWVVLAPDLDAQPEPIVWRTKRKWIEFARQNGDKTYKKFTGGKLIVPGYVTYHDKEEAYV